jgi:ElaB/YqjD/DUF883 family membrane-anchored ribosome-binding protein
MTVQDEINAKKRAAAAVAKDAAAEIREIKESVESLKSNVVGLARNVKDIGTTQAHVAADFVRDQADAIKDAGADAIVKAEERIKAQPRKSVAFAFVAGAIASYLFGRRA